MDALEGALQNGGHPGGSYSTFRILKALAPLTTRRDVVMSSKGHDYAAFLAWHYRNGMATPGDIRSYRRVNGVPGHPERGVCGANVSTGSLGMGLSKAVGLAYTDRTRRVFCIVGDGEQQEGQVWEAAQVAARLHLDNLIVILDANGAQSDNRPMPIPQDRNPDGLWKAACWTVLPSHLGEDGLTELVVPEGWPLCVLFHGEKTHPHALSTRSQLVDAYGKALRLALEADEQLVALEADLALDHGLDGLLDAFPGRILSCGISEQHMVSMAVGLAAAGKHPICHTFSRFYLRAAEQVYDALREPGLAIRFVGGLAGPLPVGPGPSHEIDVTTEAALFPIRTYTPRTPDEVGAAVQSMLKQPRSTYLRLLAQPDLT